MSDFKDKLREYFGMDPDELPLSPLDGAMRGVTKLGERAGAYLKPLGAKLDAKLGTTARGGQYEPDPLLPSEPPVQRNMGLFEGMGQGVPQLAAFVAGNHLPAGGASGSGVAAFPTPKQSLKAMQEEAVMRDLMEAKGARVVDLAPESVGSDLYSTIERQKRIQESLAGGFLNRDGSVRPPAHQFSQDALRVAKTDANNANFNRGSRLTLLDTDQALNGVASDARRAGRLAGVEDAKIPTEPIPAEQTALEKYLAGLYGPKAK